MQAHCRYGPHKAYLHSHDLYPGDHAEVHNRNGDGSWLWIKPDNLDRRCWVSASVVEVEGDVFSVVEYYHPLPITQDIVPPKNVKAVRQGDQVTVTWDDVVWPSVPDIRGFLIDGWICQNGAFFPVIVHTYDLTYVFTDEDGCLGDSRGKLYGVEKHGYTDPVKIPWPSHP